MMKEELIVKELVSGERERGVGCGGAPQLVGHSLLHAP